MDDWAVWLTPQNQWIKPRNGFQEQDLQKDQGDIPKNTHTLNGICLNSRSCKMWHVPDSNYCKSELDQKHRMCKDCLVCEQYVESALNNKQSLDAMKQE